MWIAGLDSKSVRLLFPDRIVPAKRSKSRLLVGGEALIGLLSVIAHCNMLAQNNDDPDSTERIEDQ